MSRITIRYVAIGILVMFLLPGAVCAQDDDSTREDNPYPTLESFNLILKRNIFDRNRRVFVPRREPAPRAPRTDSISLIGTLISDASSYAFFKSTVPEYNRVVLLGGQLAGYQIDSIKTDGVVLKKENQPISLSVGLGLSRQGDSPWIVSQNKLEYARETPSQPTTRTEKVSATESSTDDDTQDLLQKMRARRREETQ